VVISLCLVVELCSLVLTTTTVIRALSESDLATRIAHCSIAALVNLIACVSACRRRVDPQAYRRAIAGSTYRGITAFLAILAGTAAAGAASGGQAVLAAVTAALIGALGPVMIAFAIDTYVDC
jgi:hypothetical protein